MNVSLTQELEQLVNEKVTSGMYHSASEVIRDGLRLLQERDELRRVRLEELRREIRKGTNQLDKGEGTPLDIASIKAAGRRRLSRKQKA